jgi:hypothetical protein
MSRFSVTNFINGDEFKALMKRPNLTISDSRALADQAQLPENRGRRSRRRRPRHRDARACSSAIRRPSRS